MNENNVIQANEIIDMVVNNMHESFNSDTSFNPLYVDKETQMSIEDELDDNHTIIDIPYPKKLGYKEVELSVKNAYNTSQDYYSSAFDIIASYIKAQKILYMEAFNHCTTRLNYLMLPAIFISALASVLALATDSYPWGSVVVSGVNAFNGFLLSVISTQNMMLHLKRTKLLVINMINYNQCVNSHLVV